MQVTKQVTHDEQHRWIQHDDDDDDDDDDDSVVNRSFVALLSATAHPPSQSAAQVALDTPSARWQRGEAWLAALDDTGIPPDAWSIMTRYADSGEPLVKLAQTSNLGVILRSPNNSFAGVPLLLVTVAWLSVSDSDALAILRDPTGEMRACLSRRTVDEAGHALRPGSAMLLRDVSVFCPRPGVKYLVAIPNCILRIWAPH